MFEKYTNENLIDSLKVLKNLASDTGDQFYSNMIMKVVEELNKRGINPNR